MSKLLLLPMIALLCMSCSKEAVIAEEPDVATPRTAKADGVNPINFVYNPDSGITGNPVITYTGQDWDSHTLVIKPGNNYFNARGGSVSMSGQLGYSGYMPYVVMRYHADGHEGEDFAHTWTMPEEITLHHGVPIGEPLFGEYYTVIVSITPSEEPGA